MFLTARYANSEHTSIIATDKFGNQQENIPIAPGNRHFKAILRPINDEGESGEPILITAYEPV